MEYLIRIEPPVITDNYEFRLDSKKKSAIVAWFDVLDERGYVKHHISSQERARLINQKIHSINLGMDGKIFRDEPTNVYQRYLKKFKIIIRKNTLT